MNQRKENTMNRQNTFSLCCFKASKMSPFLVLKKKIGDGGKRNSLVDIAARILVGERFLNHYYHGYITIWANLLHVQGPQMQRRSQIQHINFF